MTSLQICQRPMEVPERISAHHKLPSENDIHCDADSASSREAEPDAYESDCSQNMDVDERKQLQQRSITMQTMMDNLLDLRTNESKYRVFNSKAEYVKYRKIIVDWMTEVGNEYKLQGTTTHMAVRYLDRILGQTNVNKNRLQLVSLACILLAAKHEEEPDLVPSMEDLNSCTNSAYTVEIIRNMEVQVLKCLEWHLNVVTPLHILNLYMQYGIVSNDDIIADGKPHTERAISYTHKYALFFSDLCIQEYGFQQYLPSELAAGIIAAARRAVRISPIWSSRLKQLTGLGSREVYPVFKAIYSFYEQTFPSGTPSDSPTDSPKDLEDFENDAMHGSV